MDFSKFELKNVKKTRGKEGDGFTATIYFDKRKIGTVENWGDGGDVHLRGLTKEDNQMVNDFVKSLPPEKTIYGDLAVSVDFFMDMLYEEIVLQKMCKTKTVFTLKGRDSEQMSINARYNDEIKAYLITKYGDQLDEIINERFLPPKPVSDVGASPTMG